MGVNFPDLVKSGLERICPGRCLVLKWAFFPGLLKHSVDLGFLNFSSEVLYGRIERGSKQSVFKEDFFKNTLCKNQHQ